MAYRGGERTKMKLRLKKNKGMVVFMTATLALIAGVATTPAAFAHTQRYIVGFQDGAHAALNDYGVSPYDESCLTRDDGSSHTSNYCAGYTDGYRAQWVAEYNYYHPVKQQLRQTIEQGSSVSIKGNNNRVAVTQQANTGAQQPISRYPVYSNDGHDKSSNSGSQSNPRCLILCANVRIN
jgi:hypothetical protein